MDTIDRNSRRFRGVGLAFLGAVALVTIAFSVVVFDLTAAPAESAPAAAAPRTGLLLPSSGFTLSLPVVYRIDSLLNPIFGVQMYVINASHGVTRAAEAHSTWVRTGGINWDAVEDVEGDYNWGVLASDEEQWINASANGLRPILIVHSTPLWARTNPLVRCGSIRLDKLAAFGKFMNALVRRYSQPPYNLEYFEIWNEPDIAPGLVPDDNPYGCWGNLVDPYYGGGYFGQMLQAVYPQIKAADPTVHVVIGGLLLDCDPNNPPSGKDCKASKFLEGILRQGGGAYFDGVGVHAYDYDGGSLGSYNNSNWHTASNSAGATLALEAKVDFVRGVMAAYGVTGKFLVNDEAGVGLLATNTNPTFETNKAYYVAEVYAAASTKNLLANIWYSLDDDWQHQSLLDSNYAPRPAFFAYKFAAEMLSNARYVQPVAGFAGVKGYVFNLHGHVLWLLWSQDGAVHVLSLPSTPASIRDVGGTPVAVTGSQVSLGPQPLYVEWSP